MLKYEVDPDLYENPWDIVNEVAPDIGLDPLEIFFHPKSIFFRLVIQNGEEFLYYNYKNVRITKKRLQEAKKPMPIKLHNFFK